MTQLSLGGQVEARQCTFFAWDMTQCCGLARLKCVRDCDCLRLVPADLDLLRCSSVSQW